MFEFPNWASPIKTLQSRGVEAYVRRKFLPRAIHA